MSHPLAAQGRRPLPLIATAAALALLALLLAPLRADAANPVILNSSNWLEGNAAGGESLNGANELTITLAVRHDRGQKVTGLRIDDDWNDSDNTGSASVRTVTTQQQSLAGGSDVSRVTYTWGANTGNMGFDCNVWGGTTNDVTKTLRVRPVVDGGGTMPLVEASVWFTKPEGCNGTEDYAYIYARSQTATEVTPGQNVTFSFKGDDPDSNGDADFNGVRWRARRLSDGATTTPVSYCPGQADNTTRSITVNFPSRGRWVVEGEALVENCANPKSGKLFRLGAVDVNSAASTSPSLSLAPATKRLDYGATETSVTATTDDDGDSGQGGNVASIEWDLDGDTGNGVNGFESALLGTAVNSGAGNGGNAITTAQKTRTVDVDGKAAGTYTVRARVSDSGALTSGDGARRTKTVTARYTVDAPPVVSTPALVATDSATPAELALSGTDGDDDPLTWSAGTVSPAGAGTVAIDGAKATFTPAADFVGTAQFAVTADDGYNGKAAPSATKTATVQVNKTGPKTTITQTPAFIDPSPAATFAFESAGAESFLCRLDGGDWETCASPVALARLTNGSHTFEVQGTDAEGTPEFFPAKHTWTVLDVTAPTATITEEPTTPGTDATPTFAFTADEDGATFTCAIDGGTPEACTSPFTPAELGDGEHTFTVVATDVGGNESLPVARTFVVDTTGPVVEITDGPAALTNDSTPEIAFSSEEGARFACRVDEGEWGKCASPTTLDELSDGEHTFAVRAVDTLRNEGAATTRTFTVDTAGPAAPAVTLPSMPTADSTPDVSFTHADDAGDGATFEVKVDDGEWEAATSPLTLPELTDGDHAVAIRSVDAAGNAGLATDVTVTVDTTAPVTEITDGPDGPTNDATPEFAFTSNDEDATYDAKVDDGEWAPAESPLTLDALDEGEHTLAVRATDALANVEDPGATRTFTVDLTAPAAPAVTLPSMPTADSTPDVSFTHADDAGDGATFQVKVDDGEWEAATSPLTLPELTDGDHAVAIRSVDAAGNEGAETTVTVTVDTTGPVVEITDGPDGATNDATPEFAFTSEAGARFACKVDDGEFGKCASPETLDELEDGEHTFTVKASDGLRNVGAEVSRTFTVDTTGPVVEITDGPAALTNDNTPELAFSSEAGARFACKVDDGEFGKCTSPVTLDELEDGEHTFTVKASDGLRNLGAEVSRTFVVDTAAPSAPTVNGPATPTADATPELTFAHAADAGEGATFEVKVDTGDWAAATSPYTPAELTDGEHTVRVRSVDAARNEGAAQAVTFTVDTTGAVAEITDGPSGLTADDTPEFAFTSEAGATFEVQVDGGDWAAATSPHTLAALDDGEHTFAVRATDALDNTGAAVSRTFTVDTTAPGAPALDGPAGSTVDTTPTYTFAHAAGAGAGATFACSVDGDDYAPCTSPTTVDALEDGRHTFRVRSVDAAGNAGEAAEKAVEVDTTAPGTVIDGGPTGTIAEATARFTFASADPDVAGFECRLDGGAWAACTSPYTTGTLANGDHVLEVRAIDALGNVETPAVARAFTVAVPAPVQQPAPQQQPTPQQQPVTQQQSSQQGPRTAVEDVLLTKVGLSRKTLTAAKPRALLSFTLAEKARVVVRVEQRVVKNGKARYRVVRRIVRTNVAAGNRTLTIARTANKRTLAAGTYRVSIVATAIDKRTQTVRTTLTVGRR